MKKNFVVFYSSFMVAVLLLSLVSLGKEVPKLGEAFKEAWVSEIVLTLDRSTLEIILNNVFVMFALWLFSVIPAWLFYRRPRSPGDEEMLARIVYIAYILYFIKEGIRIGLELLDFHYTSYIFSLLTLILPHGIIEMGALALTGAFALDWATNLGNGFRFPKRKYFIIPTFLIVFSGILETTLTPYVFRSFL